MQPDVYCGDEVWEKVASDLSLGLSTPVSYVIFNWTVII